MRAERDAVVHFRNKLPRKPRALHGEKRYGARLRRCIYTGVAMHSWTAVLGLRRRRLGHLYAACGRVNEHEGAQRLSD